MKKKLKFKAISIILVSVLLVSGIGYLVLDQYFIVSLLAQEKVFVTEEVDHIEKLLEQYMENLGSTAMDWGPWNDTLFFITNQNEDYIDNNLNPETLASLNVDAAIFFDDRLKVQYGVCNNGETNSELPGSFKALLEKEAPKLFAIKDKMEPTTGIIEGPEGPMIFAAAPITDSEFIEPQQGTLVFAAYIDEDIISAMEKINQKEIDVLPVSAIGETTELGEKSVDFFKSENKYVHVVDKNNVVGYSLVKGSNGEPLFILKVSTDRKIFDIGKQSANLFIFLSFLIVTIISATGLLIIQKLIITPICHLKETIKNLDLDNLSFNRLRYKGEDEICELTYEINKMLLRIEKDNKDILDGKKQLQLAIEGANVGFWDYNCLTRQLYVNIRIGEINDYSTGEMRISDNEFRQRIHPDDYVPTLRKIGKSIEDGRELENLEFRVINNNGVYSWISIRGRIVDSDTSGPLRMTGIVIDIDERKKTEDELKHLSYFDKVTGLYNRGYFEYMLDKKVAEREFPFTIIIGDINGLKLVNDTFGHTMGDKLIAAIAEILNKSCRKRDVICRWGGDEFAIILHNAGEEIAEQVCARVKAGCASKEMEPIALSISLGYSVAKANKQIKRTIKEAEERMYRNKLFEDQSARSSIITSLQRTLVEKSHETEEHTRRIYDKCLRMGQKLEMSNAKLDELLLLAFMHDIGKIAIPDYILNKPGELDQEEWEIMKTHTAIGYRIASASPDLSHIAYAILTHHEHYDGSGYPKGLKGKAIPRISRILSIVDAYDVMTNDRPYRKALTNNQALEEIKRCSGTQFDPELVEVFIEILNEEPKKLAG